MPDIDIVRQVYPTINAINVLFLGDGFHGNADQARFYNCVIEISDRFFRNIGPFDLPGVKEQFNIFSLYTESPSSGISCESPIDPNSGEMYSLGKSLATGMLADKQSALGLAYKGGAEISPGSGKENVIPNLIATLTHPLESPTASAIPDCWLGPAASDPARPYLAKDLGAVCVLVNDDVDGGTAIYGPDYCFYMVALEHLPGFNVTNSTGHQGSLQTPTGSTVTLPEFDHEPKSPRNRYNYITDVFAHELGHYYFDLADEYATNYSRGGPDWQAILAEVERAPNVTHKQEASSPAGPWTAIKWDKPRHPGTNLRIIRKAVMDYMTDPNLGPRPLFAGICPPPPSQVGKDDASTTMPPPALKKCGWYSDQVIGVYEGGATEYCGIYRPAGQCKMRASTGRWIQSGGRYKQVEFCYVCKYAIIEKIDPSLLPRLAKKQYPR